MAKIKRYKVIGTSKLVDTETGEKSDTSVVYEDKDGKVTVKVGDPGKSRDGDTISSSDMRVRLFQLKVVRAHQARAYRMSRVQPIWKQQGKSKPKKRRGPCPECNGLGEAYIKDRLVSCPVCSKRRA